MFPIHGLKTEPITKFFYLHPLWYKTPLCLSFSDEMFQTNMTVKMMTQTLCNSYSTFVSAFTIKRPKGENPWHLNGEDTEQMYSKHLSV